MYLSEIFNKHFFNQMDFTTFTGLQKDMSQEKKYERQIPGEFGRPVFMSEEEFEEGYKRSIIADYIEKQLKSNTDEEVKSH